jgi:L-lysine 2,3-aminomutase
VLLSGGDPLSLSDRRLAPLVRELEAIPHLRRLRIHTRLPVVLPERVDADLLAWLADCRLTRVLVIHANHARELDGPVHQALSEIRKTGTHLLNQAVLLRGVNDSVAALAELSEALIDTGVQPYYLHLLDRVAGTAHFEVPRPRPWPCWARCRRACPATWCRASPARKRAPPPSTGCIPETARRFTPWLGILPLQNPGRRTLLEGECHPSRPGPPGTA